MTINLLTNPNFDGGWIDLLPYSGTTNQCPAGYNLQILLPGTRLYSANSYEGPDDAPVYDTVVVVPEGVHKLRAQLPDADDLILEGDVVFKMFSATNPFSVTLIAEARMPASGTLDIVTPVQVHQHGDGSPGAAVWRQIIDAGVWESEGRWRTFGDGFTDREYAFARFSTPVVQGEVITAIVQMESRTLGGIDFFTDAWRFDFTPDAEPLPIPEPEPDPVDYVVVVNLLPQDATQNEKENVLGLVHESRETILQSADDAARLVAPGADGSLVRVWDAYRWPGDEDAIGDWLEAHGVGLVEYWYLFHPEPEPEPIPDPEPPDPVPDPVTGAGFDNLPKALSAGLHFTAGPPGKLPDNSPAIALPDTSQRYISEGKPSIVKGVSGGDVYRVGRYARQYSPGTRTVWRRVVGDGNYITGNLRDQAQRYLDQYKAEAETASRNLGITLDEFWNHIDYIGGLNELISNWGGNTDTQVEFECNLADLVDSQIKHGTKATMLAVAIGNPNHEPADILRMLPAAQMSAEHGHILDYHAYWTAGHEPDRSYLDAHWKWHAGRWAEWDKVFAAAGVAPLYMFGEGGMVYDPNAGGTWLGSGRAWRDAGSILYFLDQIKRQNEHIRDWNATHGNRCLGGVLFTCEYSWGWDEFLLRTGDLLEILAWMRTL